MARFTGYRCDVCDKSGDASEKGMLPSGWMQIVLPDTPDNPRPEDRSRDICCGKCLAEFGKERGQADGSIRVSGPRTQMDEGLKAFLNEMGITGKAMGAKAATHARFHQDTVDDECPVCLYNATQSAPPVGAGR